MSDLHMYMPRDTIGCTRGIDFGAGFEFLYSISPFEYL